MRKGQPQWFFSDFSDKVCSAGCFIFCCCYLFPLARSYRCALRFNSWCSCFSKKKKKQLENSPMEIGIAYVLKSVVDQNQDQDQEQIYLNFHSMSTSSLQLILLSFSYSLTVLCAWFFSFYFPVSWQYRWWWVVYFHSVCSLIILAFQFVSGFSFAFSLFNVKNISSKR